MHRGDMARLDFFAEAHRIILLNDVRSKCEATQRLHEQFDDCDFHHDAEVKTIDCPGYPSQLTLVAPRELKRRGMQSQLGRNTLLHAVAHIEFNAINLALDAAYRFRNQPQDFYRDWLSIAADEARHFRLLQDYLQAHDCDYGDYPAHNGLWEMAVQTQDDIVARMALVPRVLEARGLDVTPGMIQRLEGVNDQAAVDILKIIYQDEIQHVYTGSKWFKHQCHQLSLEPRSTFELMVDTHLHGQLRGPFNLAARLKAGFDEEEMQRLEHKSLNR